MVMEPETVHWTVVDGIVVDAPKALACLTADVALLSADDFASVAASFAPFARPASFVGAPANLIGGAAVSELSPILPKLLNMSPLPLPIATPWPAVEAACLPCVVVVSAVTVGPLSLLFEPHAGMVMASASITNPAKTNIILKFFMYSSLDFKVLQLVVTNK